MVVKVRAVGYATSLRKADFPASERNIISTDTAYRMTAHAVKIIDL
jgi:hypothetical protein